MQAWPAALNPCWGFKWVGFYRHFHQKLSTFFSAIVSRGHSRFGQAAFLLWEPRLSGSHIRSEKTEVFRFHGVWALVGPGTFGGMTEVAWSFLALGRGNLLQHRCQGKFGI